MVEEDKIDVSKDTQEITKPKRRTVSRTLGLTIAFFYYGCLAYGGYTAIRLGEEAYNRWEKHKIELATPSILSNYLNNVDDFHFNHWVKTRKPVDYNSERSALSNLKIIGNSSETNVNSIDDLFNNTVIVGQMELPILDVDDLITHLWSLNGKPRETDYTIWGPNNANGILITDQGHIITSEHVIDNEFSDYHKVVIINGNKKIHNAQVLAVSRKYDLALLKTDLRQEVTPIILRDEKSLESKTRVYSLVKSVQGQMKFDFTVGNFRLLNRDQINIEQITSTGHFHEIYRMPIIGPDDDILSYSVKTDSFARGGYSGGVVVDENGRVIGIHSRSGNGFSYLSPASRIKELVDFYLENLEKQAKNKAN